MPKLRQFPETPRLFWLLSELDEMWHGMPTVEANPWTGGEALRYGSRGPRLEPGSWHQRIPCSCSHFLRSRQWALRTMYGPEAFWRPFNAVPDLASLFAAMSFVMLQPDRGIRKCSQTT